jgi:uncharacterized protein (TIGR03437 family)
LSTSTVQCASGGTAPTACNGTSVLINGSAVPLLFVSAGQVNFVVPFGIAPGTATVQVSNSGGMSPSIVLNVVPASPGIFLANGNGDFLSSSLTLITAASPAHPGDTITGFAAGLGITNPTIADGTSPGVSPLYPTAGTVGVTVGGVPAQVAFAGLAPGQVGFYQVGFTVPAGLLGDQPVVFTVDGVSSNSANLPLAAGSPAALTITSGPDLGTWPIGEDQISLTATGGNGSYTWNFVSGNLPTGLVLRTDVPSFFPAGTGTGLIGVATTPGSYSFTLSVTSAGTTIPRTFTIKITGLTLKDPFNVPNAFAGSAYSYQLTALNASGSVTWTANSGLPPNMSISAGGLLSGTPTVPGFYNINFSFKDSVDTVFRSIGLNVWAVQITSPGLLPNATQNAAYNFTLAASGGTPPYTFTANGLPNGLSLNSSTGAISGTVNAGQNKYGINVTAVDSHGASYTKNMAIDVVGTPEQTQQIAPYGNLDDCTIGVGCSRGIGVYSGGTAPYTWNVTGLPPGMSFRSGSGITASYVTAGELEMWGTPTALGTYNVNVTATDANGLSVTQVFALKVGAMNMDTFLPNGTVGVPYAKAFHIVGGVPPYTVAEIPTRSVPGTLPAGLAFNGVVVSGTPTEGGFFNPLFLFTDSASIPNTLTLTQFPFINGAAGTSINVNTYTPLFATLNQPYSFQLGACCVASYSWTKIGGNLPPNITLSSSGLLSGTPSTAGTYTFMVQATQTGDSSNFGTRQLTLVVSPIAVTTNFTLPFGNVNVVYSQPLAASGGTGALTWSLAAGQLLPPGLSLNGATGVISGTPSVVGQYFFNVNVSDSAGHANIGFFGLEIFATNGAPPLFITNGANLGTFSMGEIQLSLVASGGTGSYSWSVLTGFLPTGVALRTDTPSFFPSNAHAGLMGVATVPGLYSFTLQVTSGTQTISQVFTLRVSGLASRENSGFRLPDPLLSSPYSYALTALNNAGPITWTAVSGLPPGITLATNGVLSGTPTQAGFYNVTFSMNDTVDTVNATVSLSVSIVQFSTAPLLPNATQHASYSFTVTATGGTAPYTYSLGGGLPGGLSLNASTGLISGTVTTGPSKYGFNLTATDSHGVSYTKNMAIDVIGVPATLPYLFPYGMAGILDDCTLGVSCLRGIGTSNGGTAPFAYAVTGLPPGMTFLANSGFYPFATPGDLILLGTPLATGTFTLQVTVTDATGVTSQQTFPLIVSKLMVDGGDFLPGGTRGVAYSKLLRVLGGTPAVGSPLYGAAINTRIAPPNYVGLPNGLSLAGMTVSGTPGENGGFSPQIRFTDSAGNALNRTESFFIGGGTSTVSVNQTFTQTFNLGTAAVGTVYSNQLSACCVSSFTWSQAGGSLPPGLTFSAGGLLSGTLTTAGTYVFLVQAADSTDPGNFGVRQLQLIVTPLNITTAGTLPSGNVNVAYSQSLTATGATGAVTWTIAVGSNQLPPGLVLSAAGVVSGTPTQSGQYFFWVLATDSATPAPHVYYKQIGVSIYANGAGSALRFVPVTPCRVADTRNPAGPFGGPRISGGGTRDFIIPNSACGVPFTAQAYSMNVAVVPAGPLGFLTMFPSGQTQPVASTLNSLDGRIKSNAAIVPAGAGGAISVFASNATDVILDINGYFVPATDPAALAFYPITPCRIADTRNAPAPLGGPSLGGGQSRTFPIPSAAGCNIPAGAQAYSLNFAAVPKGPLGFVTAWPSGQSQPLVASLNALTGTVTANAAIVPAGTGGSIDVFASNPTDLIIDINGYFAPMAGGGLSLYNVAPCRALDTRQTAGAFTGKLDVPIAASACGIPATAQAHVLSATVVPSGALGFLTLWPQGQVQPNVATLNALDGAITSNLAIVPTANGTISALVTNLSQLILDVFGYFAP